MQGFCQLIPADYAREAGREHYGSIHHPTLQTIVESLLIFSETYRIPLSEIVLWKDDVTYAFCQINIHPSLGALKLVMSLFIKLGYEEFIAIYLVGTFGWGFMPFVFAVFTRAIERLIRAQIPLDEGFQSMYVDDMMGFSVAHCASTHQVISQQAFRSVFGSTAVSMTKTVSPTSAGDIVIGYWIDLSTGFVRPNDKGLDKLFFCLFLFR